MIRTIIDCMYLRSLLLGTATVLAGCAAAFLHGNFEFLPAILTLLFVVFAQIAANLYHRYADAIYNYGDNIDMEVDDSDTDTAPLAAVLKESSIASAILAAMFGVSLMTQVGWWSISIGICILIATYLNSSGLRPLSRSWMSTLLTFLFFGPIGVVGTCLIQATYENNVTDIMFDLSPAIYLGITMGLFALNSQLLHNYTNCLRDIENNKETFASRFGLRTTRILLYLSWAGIILLSGLLVYGDHLESPGLLIAIPTVCVAASIAIWIKVFRHPGVTDVTNEWMMNLCILAYAISACILFAALGIHTDSPYIYY